MKYLKLLPTPQHVPFLSPKLAICLIAFAAPQIAKAATVGYWRFEDSGALGTDSGSNALDLTNNNTVAAAGAIGSGTVLRTGATSAGSGDFEQSSAQYLSVSDGVAFAFQSFTIEAYVRVESIGSGSTARVIASQLNTGTGVSAGWQFGVTGAGSGLGGSRPFIQLSGDGSNLIGFTPEASNSTSAFRLTVGSDYYIAATVNFTGSTLETTFYHQNLTAGTELISVAGSVTFPSGISDLPASLFNSTADFAIGASFANGSASRHFDGLIDEVRLSDTVLSQSELLAVPEPSPLALLAAGTVLFGGIRRRNR